jgi:RNA polymerase sigma factor (sigma-70 family)
MLLDHGASDMVNGLQDRAWQPQAECGATDGELLARFVARREEAAFAELVRRHGPMVLGVCRRVLHDPHDAEDAFQVAFLVLARKAASLAQPELLGNWLYGAAYRAALEVKAARTRRQAREKQVSPTPEPQPVVECDVWEDLRPLLDANLNRLPDKYRTPLVLCDLEGRTRKEVAQQLGIAEGTLSSRLATARQLLARRLARRRLALPLGVLAAALTANAASAAVPPALGASTVQAAAGTATVYVSAHVAALTHSVLKGMALAKYKIAAVAALLLAAVGGVVLAIVHLFSPGPQRDDPAPQSIVGVLKSVDPDHNTITVTRNEQGREVDQVFALPPNFLVDLDGKQTPIGELKVGANVHLQMIVNGQTVIHVQGGQRQIQGQWQWQRQWQRRN